ncbi:inositol monophosphatase family protein [Novosphingobium sp.]|uniref:inositol monophosphatase family protein n=1 Tax=Novosphingobium sp. TaxID=1874826 RepID=UPI0022C70D32|nr:inositol monophosphatase family protein [Novosphingobium sp.]MCZ8017649.1 inositol monophosphatase [Novosphingobium sp.]MCZ8033827.1 inositol monophosphatase [Novosphingobium sp.]MCZ8051183.1 inositol monophosphatase [Novosphingobium sp.]MCZ8059529.1 inositol monophosphatase [Novosphingobium sp.]MCZ8231367.1 inositol monophosphatase [Novosphingobium sp.]
MSTALDAAVLAVIKDAAARAVMPRYQQLEAHEVIDKSPGELVTVADREAEEILAEGLARILPEAAIVGEEACEANPALMDRLGDALCWIIDPIDGTSNFAAGKPPFGIMVALAEAGETIGGWIYDPLHGRFCTAHKGHGAFIDGSAVTARTSGQTPPIAAISLVFADPTRREALKTHIAPHYTLVDIPRCAAEQYPRIVLGQNDITIFERTLAWDHAAGVLFLNEAGGKVARPDGAPYRVDQHLRPSLIGAASPALWDELAERMAAL